MHATDSPEQRMLIDSAGKLTDRVATPEYVRQLDRERKYPYELYKAWVEAGFFALPYPEQYGGLGGSVADLVLIAERISRPSGDLAMAFGASTFCGINLLRSGSPEQKQHWIPKVISGEVRMAISISEPEAGSDVGAMRTVARRDGDHYVINGQKVWATGAGADRTLINMYVKTDPSAHYRNGMSLFLIDNTTPGLEIRKLDMLGRRSVGTYEIFLNNVRVPADRLVGGENNGWRCILSGLQAERVIAAACDCGTTRGVIDMAVAYAKERKQFDQPIGTFQSIAHALANVECDWKVPGRSPSARRKKCRQVSTHSRRSPRPSCWRRRST